MIVFRKGPFNRLTVKILENVLAYFAIRLVTLSIWDSQEGHMLSYITTGQELDLMTADKQQLK